MILCDMRLIFQAGMEYTDGACVVNHGHGCMAADISGGHAVWRLIFQAGMEGAYSPRSHLNVRSGNSTLPPAGRLLYRTPHKIRI